MIILKYGSSKKLLKKNPRRKHTCGKCGCKVMLEEDDFKDKDRDYDCWRYTYECPYCNKDESFEVYDRPGVVRFFEDRRRNFDNFLWRHDLEVVPWLVGVIIGAVLVVLVPVLAYFGWNNSHHAYRMNFNIGGKSYTEWTDSYKIIDGDIIFKAGDNKYCVDMDEIVVINTKTEEEIDIYEDDGDNSQETS